MEFLMKILIAYFSAEKNRTASVALSLKEFLADRATDSKADVVADVAADVNVVDVAVFEIVPEKPYTPADLRWVNPLARCNREKFTGKDVPVSGTVPNWEQYDIVFLGFPIWYGCAPNVVNTFCKAYDWSGKKVYSFATSGGSGIGKTAEKLKPYLKGALSVEARLTQTASELKSWAKDK